ncbi:hypothetical protein C8R44DRAFT_888321 [Mycena epipterygia]|nr:hypothetical protein C8R44DRAFT_888321 [Mycena epipterygia]
MVLTRRAHKAISRWLPNEVLTEIIEVVPNLADRASLCRVSKLFHALCLPILYRVVHLDVNLHSAVTFSSSLKENPARADAIRHLIVTSTMYYRGPATFLPSLDVGLGLREARIQWSSSEVDDLENIVVALNSLTRHDIPFTCCSEDCDDAVDTPQIMDSISKNIPHTKTLQLVCQNAYLDDDIEIADTIRRIRESLPRFTSLVYLAMEGYWPVKNEAEQIEVEAWGRASLRFNRP